MEQNFLINHPECHKVLLEQISNTPDALVAVRQITNGPFDPKGESGEKLLSAREVLYKTWVAGYATVLGLPVVDFADFYKEVYCYYFEYNFDLNNPPTGTGRLAFYLQFVFNDWSKRAKRAKSTKKPKKSEELFRLFANIPAWKVEYYERFKRTLSAKDKGLLGNSLVSPEAQRFWELLTVDYYYINIHEGLLKLWSIYKVAPSQCVEYYLILKAAAPYIKLDPVAINVSALVDAQLAAPYHVVTVGDSIQCFEWTDGEGPTTMRPGMEEDLIDSFQFRAFMVPRVPDSGKGLSNELYITKYDSPFGLEKSRAQYKEFLENKGPCGGLQSFGN